MSKLFLLGKIAGAIMFIVGFALNYIISRRRFYRRSITGAQMYRSYEQSWMTRWAEGIGKLIAIILIIAGFMLFVGSFMVPPKIK